MGYSNISFDAVALMKSGEYFNNRSKKENAYDGAEQGGFFQDEIVKIGDESIWFYHAHPIASYNHVTGKWKRSSCGYCTTTTKLRLNSLAGPETGLPHIWQEDFKWYSDGEFQDQEIRPHWHKIDGWRGLFLPPFAVAGVSNTGGWSDSPARPETGEKEIGELASHLRANGIRTFRSWTVTSNIFCVMVYLNVRGRDWEKAKPIADSWLDENNHRTELIHKVA